MTNVPEYELYPTPDITGEEWRERSACKGLDPSLFIVPSIGRPRKGEDRREDKAKNICHNICPVQLDCELSGSNAPGIWGGYSEKERHARRAARRRGEIK